ncbi:MAG: hypothetical protein NZ822_01365 [Patescibacteria group bacterium]|nr:hypothetical protein [Patescibacteria group bacterium]
MSTLINHFLVFIFFQGKDWDGNKIILLTVDELDRGLRFDKDISFHRSAFVYNGYLKKWQQIMERKKEYFSILSGSNFVAYKFF